MGALRCSTAAASVTANWASRQTIALAQCAIRSKGDCCMTERITNKARIEALLQAGKAPREIAEFLGIARRYAVAVAWRLRNPEHEKAIKRACSAAPESRPGVAEQRA